jgi:hypothetical protein
MSGGLLAWLDAKPPDLHYHLTEPWVSLHSHLILGELRMGPLFGTVQFPSGASPVEGPHVGLAPSQHQSVPSTGMSRWAMRNVAPALWYPFVVDRSVMMRKAVRGAFAGK